MAMDAFRSDPWWLAWPARSLRYRTFCRLWAVGAFVHITLPHFWDAAWALPWLLSFAGLLLVAWRGCFLGWALSLIGLVIPIVWLEDQLTQSSIMLLLCAGAVLLFVGSRSAREPRMELTFSLWVRVLTVAVYLTAVFHKLNRDFLDGAISCASGGATLLFEGWGGTGPLPDTLLQYIPIVFLIVEALLGFLFLARPGQALLLGALMHLPLTVVFAPAFAFTLIPGWLLFLREQEVQHLLDVFQRKWKPIVACGSLLGASSTLLYLWDHPDTDWYWQFKEGLMWVLLVGLIVAYATKPEGIFTSRSAWLEGPSPRRSLISALLVVWTLNALSPYTGLQFHRAGAMLSNLRIDSGCWNHVLVPESFRLRDPYIRIDDASVGEVRGARNLEASIEGRLWSPQGLWQSRERWCAAGAAPIWLRGNAQGEGFTVSDLCASWPFEPVRWPGFRAYQVNLDPECPQACIH